MSNSTESRDALASPNRSPIRLIFIGHGLTTEIDNCDADLQSVPWFCQIFDTGTYATRRVNRAGKSKRLYLARVIAERMGLDLSAGQRIDHINGDTLDNRRANLRSVTAAVNARNTNRLSRNNSSGFIGVSFDASRKTKPWKAYIKTDRVQKNLGYFSTPEAANAARLEAEAARWGVQPQREGAHQ